jgi:hypothetical protein
MGDGVLWVSDRPIKQHFYGEHNGLQPTKEIENLPHTCLGLGCHGLQRNKL